MFLQHTAVNTAQPLFIIQDLINTMFASNTAHDQVETDTCSVQSYLLRTARRTALTSTLPWCVFEVAGSCGCSRAGARGDTASLCLQTEDFSRTELVSPLLAAAGCCNAVSANASMSSCLASAPPHRCATVPPTPSPSPVRTSCHPNHTHLDRNLLVLAGCRKLEINNFDLVASPRGTTFDIHRLQWADEHAGVVLCAVLRGGWVWNVGGRTRWNPRAAVAQVGPS